MYLGYLYQDLFLIFCYLFLKFTQMAQALEINEDKKSEKSTRSFKKGHRRAQSMPSHYIGKQSQRYTRNQENDKTQVVSFLF
ncbi:unnamed protein product [Meloidogyne enterolobii]|uniref:Uncharacterized protein n=1 Tax=Meloidogyne enterolobii TaxID=390850 RepID=A0ACB0ZZA5_MELEN